MPVPNPDHLLDQADRLLSLSAGGARRQVDLRRAISNAYYAVFHVVVTEAADDFTGKTQRQSPRYRLVYRSIDHKALLRLCEDLKKQTLPMRYSNYEPQGGFGADLIAVATAIVDLQEKRHLADYDPLFRATMSDTLLAVETGRTALDRFRNASRQRRKAFVSLVVFAPR